MKQLFKYVGYTSIFPLLVLFWPIATMFYLLFYHERGKRYKWDDIELIGMTVLAVIFEVVNIVAIVFLFGGIAK